MASGRQVDVACINAGVGVGGLFRETSLDEELNMVDLNCASTVQLAKYVVRHMADRNAGRILFTASIAGEMVAPREAVYAATKAFVLSFAHSVRYELKDTNVSVTALQPGPTDTDFFHRAGMDDTEAGQKGKLDSSPAEVARQGLDALMDGKDHIYSASMKTKMEGMLGMSRRAVSRPLCTKRWLRPTTKRKLADTDLRLQSGFYGLLSERNNGGIQMSQPLTEKPNAEQVPFSASAAVILDGRYLPPPQDKDGKIWARTSAIVQANADELYALWRDVESAPKWQEQITSVRQTSDVTSHWIMESDGEKIEWDSEILADEPGKRIAWRSIAGDSSNAGEVIFDAAPGDRGTLVAVLQEFRIGKIANVWETLVGRNPKQSVIENLRHFKAFAETGEIPRTQGQPSGPRGIIGKMKKSLYGETINTPPAEKAS